MPEGDHKIENKDQRSKYLVQAKKLAPIFRERAIEAEELRRMPDETVADIVASGIPRMCQPKRFGGAELPWDALVEVVIELGKGCGSQAWVADVFSEHNCHLGHFPNEAQHDVWDDNPEALISTSYAPTGKAERVDGGWKLSGRWGFSSGVEHSSWTILGVLLPDADGEKSEDGPGRGYGHGHHFMLVPAADRIVLDTWHTIGLAGTGSHDVTVEDTFVPDHRVLDTRLTAVAKSPGAEHNTAPVFKMPHLGFAQPSLAGVAVGIASGAVADFEEMLKTRKVRGKLLGDIQGLQLRLAEASAEIEAARLLAMSTAQENMDLIVSGKVLDMADLGRSRRNAAYAVKLAKAATQRVFEATGGQGIYVGQPIQRAFRDIQAAASHIALGWDLSATIYSKQALGLDMSDVL
ncbi:MAG: acyl-CoA dehydrogenase family protein [Rhodospirillales bacterium]|jgi:alkylation response protein AidB-like acyl-CoA dehydrogenase